MKIQITTTQGEKITMQVKDADMATLLGRLHGPNSWVEAEDDKRLLINGNSIVMIRKVTEPQE